MKLAGSEPSPEWMDEVIGKLGLSKRSTTCRTSCPVVSSSV